MVRLLHDEGMAGYRAIAGYFGVSRDTVAAICQYRRRRGYRSRDSW